MRLERELVLSTPLHLQRHDRLLVLAPHPDDESLACGRLLQIAGDVGAAKRVLVITDGDNNPWPQRWMERRWRIGAEQRLRWGLRRREEARAALMILGVAESEVGFFGLPDLGITQLLLNADPILLDRLRTEIEEFKPTLIIAPALSDRHPDHSALHVALRLVLAHQPTARVLSYVMHGQPNVSSDIEIAMDVQQQQRKRAAIAAHTSQMVLSRQRFLSYADEPERFIDETRTIIDAPIQATFTANAMQLRIELKRWRWRLRDCVLYLVLQTANAGCWRWRLLLPRRSRRCELRDAGTGRVLNKIDVEVAGGIASMTIPLTDGPFRAYAKLEITGKSLLVFDRAGWCVLQ